ncbi:MAG: FKBP-type peptidyl-prolyl cis-trans isomerase [Bacillariaceae sp.]|jgi:FKBP-type peptidyl-prolyl cis-trans isomerase
MPNNTVVIVTQTQSNDIKITIYRIIIINNRSKMKYTATVLTLVSVAVVAVSAEDAAADPKVIPGKLNVHRYEGPKDCDDEDKIMAGKFVKMHYTGSIHESSETGEKGKKFDSSLDRGATFDFQVGVGQVIKGWDVGLVNLCKGVKVRAITSIFTYR